jgi:hypothetical protein
MKLFNVLVLSASLVSPAFADDAAVRAGFESARKLFDSRSATNLEPTNRAEKLLADLANQAQDEDLKFDILILRARALNWNGAHTEDKDAKMAIHELGQKVADDAKAVSDLYAEAPYFAGIHLARWAEAKGVIASLGRKKELIAYMESAIAKITRDDQAGETVDGYGPNRVLGRMYHKLPGFAGGSHEKSLEFLEVSFKNAKNYANNVTFLADTLRDGNDAEKARAKQILTDLLAQDAEKYNPARTPETREEFAEGREILKKMGR